MPFGRSYQHLIGAGSRRRRHRQRERARRAHQQQPVPVRRREHDRPDDRHVRRQPELRGDSGSDRLARRASRPSSAAPGRDRRRHHEVGHQPLRRLVQVPGSQRQLECAEHHQSEVARGRVAGANAIRQGELHLQHDDVGGPIVKIVRGSSWPTNNAKRPALRPSSARDRVSRPRTTSRP